MKRNSTVNKILRKLTGISLLFAMVFTLSCHAQSYSGTDFWFGYLNNDDDNTQTLQVHVASAIATSGTVSVPLGAWSQAFTVAANTVTTITVPTGIANHIGVSDAVRPKGVHVVLNDPCVVYVGNYIPFSSDVATAIPTNALGSSYHVIAYGDKSFTNPSEFIIIGTQDGTNVTVNLSQASVNKTANSTQVFTLNKGETYHVKSQGTIGLGVPPGSVWNTDLTGSTVVATKPVALYAGNWCGVVGGCTACDHMFEQIRPPVTWANDHYVANTTKPGTTADRLRIYSFTAGTIVSINGVAQPSMAARTWTDLDIAGVGMHITSNNPVYVAQYLRGSACSAPPLQIDPLQMDVPPVQQYGFSYIFATSPYARYTGGHYATVFIPTAQIGTLRLNGAALVGTTFTAIPTSSYSFGYITLAAATNYSIISTNNTPFGLLIYGYGQEESYGYTAGGYLTNLTLLPIELKNFSVTAKNNLEAELTWTTASEKNNAYFEIEYSMDGIGFASLKKITAVGNSTSEMHYTYVHANPIPGINYYRLKQVDFDGKSTFSDVRSLLIQKEKVFNLSGTSYDASSNKLMVSIQTFTSNPINYSLFDMAGRKILGGSYTPTNEGSNIIDININSSLNNGMYILDVAQEGSANAVRTKFIK